MAVERSELQLVWPPGLFAAEARALLAAGVDDDSLAGLLAEAFHGGRAEKLVQQVALGQPHQPGRLPGPWASGGSHALDPEPYAFRGTARLVAGLADEADSLPRYTPRQLFRQRQRVAAPVVLSLAECKAGFAALIGELTWHGYFEDAFGS